MSPSDHYWRRYLVGQWLVFGWFWGCGTADSRLARRKLAKKSHPNHGGRRRPTAAMVPPSRRRRTQQSANMLRYKSMSLKLDNIIVFTINLAIKGMARRWRHRRKVPAFGCCNGCRWPTWAGGQCRRLFDASLAIVSAWRNRGRK